MLPCGIGWEGDGGGGLPGHPRTGGTGSPHFGPGSLALLRKAPTETFPSPKQIGNHTEHPRVFTSLPAAAMVICVVRLNYTCGEVIFPEPEGTAGRSIPGEPPAPRPPCAPGVSRLRTGPNALVLPRQGRWDPTEGSVLAALGARSLFTPGRSQVGHSAGSGVPPAAPKSGLSGFGECWTPGRESRSLPQLRAGFNLIS